MVGEVDEGDHAVAGFDALVHQQLHDLSFAIGKQFVAFGELSTAFRISMATAFFLQGLADAGKQAFVVAGLLDKIYGRLARGFRAQHLPVRRSIQSVPCANSNP